MIRIPTIFGIVLLAAGLAVGVFLVQKTQRVNPRAAESSPNPENITISNVTDQSFTVSWTTSTPVTGYLQAGTSGQSLSRRVIDDRDKIATSPGVSSTHYVTVDSLQPDTEYQFRLGEGTTALFDQNGKPFSVMTARTMPANQVSDLAQGTVATSAGQPGGGAIVYAQLPGAQLLSSLASSSGNWIVPLSTARVSDLSSSTTYDRSTTVYALRVDGGVDGRSNVTLTTASDNPTPPIVLGQSYDFRQSKTPITVNSTPALSGGGTSEETASTEATSVFEFSSLGPVTQASGDVTLDNPKNNGEVIETDKPEFFGKGPVGTQVEVTVHSSQQVSANVEVSPNGGWSLETPTSLSPGTHEITIRWTDAEGILQTLTRSFIVNAAGGPAFTSTPSATPRPETLTPTITIGVSPSPTPPIGGSPRTVIPSGTPPESGSLTPSVLLFMIGSLLTIAGVALVRQGVDNAR